MEEDIKTHNESRENSDAAEKTLDDPLALPAIAELSADSLPQLSELNDPENSGEGEDGTKRSESLSVAAEPLAAAPRYV